ncbi:MAG: hypothetical protein GXP31_15985, partial [Kiritimatiellaeota bacterium]|nr:hypothetical protein [Kiritimatiellota bacterium]
CPIVWRAAPGEKAVLSAGRAVDSFTRVRDPAVLERLDPAVRDRVLQADLRAMGISEYGDPGGGGVFLYFRGEPMTVARWPNEGFVRIKDVVGGKPFNVRGTKGDRIGKFEYEGDRPSRWTDENDLWLHGFWFWDWADQRQPVAKIDTEKHIITLAKPYHRYGYRKGQWYYAFNALSELDAPGEWFLDRKAGVLYFLPPAQVRPGDAVVSLLPRVVTFENTSRLTFRGFVIEASRHTPITMKNTDHCRIEGCVIRCTGRGAVSIGGGRDSGVAGCDITGTAGGAVSLYSGDRKTLTPARLYADNNHIHHYSYWWRMYGPAVGLGGVGNRVTHNLIDNAPHCAIMFGGNDHVIEYNEIHSVCYESNDAGAIYAGRDWTMRGTVIRYNYLHHINGFRGRGCVGVYLDDMFCGTKIYGNVFYKVTRAAFIGGGRDNLIENNMFVDCPRAIHMDARAMGWAAGSVPTTMTTRLKAMPYKSEVWRAKYPKLPGILDDEPAKPKGNIIRRNIAVGERWNDISGRARTFVKIEDDLLDADPRFVDPEHPERAEYRLRPDSPAWKVGFKPIPFSEIGPRPGPDRASWPVRSTVRPMETPPTRRRVRRGPRPNFKVPTTRTPITVDGRILPAEWDGADPAKALVIEQGVNGKKTKPRSFAWLRTDGKRLFVAVDNRVSASRPVRRGDQWGRDDAVELAFRVPRSGGKAPILILRGYTTGTFESSDEAGAPAAAVKRAREGVRYAARVVGPTQWTCEWSIPLLSLGIAPKKTGPIEFNLSVRKSAQPLWQMWRGTDACTWEVGRAGTLDIAAPAKARTRSR